MRTDLLDKLNTARSAKQRACLVRFLDSDDEALVIAGDVVMGSLPPAVMQEIANAHRQDKSRTVETEQGRAFLQIFNPPLRLLIVGAVHISQLLAPIAALAGYAVTIVDPRGAFATEDRFPGVNIVDEWPDDAMTELTPDRRTAVVTLTHDPKLDDPALDVALRSEAFYIASLGSKRTHAGRVERLTALGHSVEAIERIHGPAGLNIGAISPAEIAISVMAQMTSALRKPS